MRNVIFILIIGLVFILNAFPQDVRFTAKAKSAVAEGDQFRLVYEVNASGSGFRAPDLSDFNVLMGPSSQQSSSIQIINGQVTQNVSNSYTYLLQAKKEGKYEIAPAEITVGGKSYQSNSLTIDVVKGTPPVSSGQSNQGGGGQNNAVNASGDDLYVRIHLSRSSLYQGEHLVATIKIYTKLNLVGFEDMKFPSFNGFWSQDVETPKQIQLVREMINGEAYNVGVLAQYVLYPQRSGELTIDPFEIDCVVQKRVSGGSNNFFDSFFSRYQNFSQKAISPSVKVNVMSLPSNKPDGFTGAVGNFKMDATLDKNEVKANEPITLKIKVSGNGNLKLVDIPEFEFPSDFEVYDPQVSENITTNAAGATGTKSVEYLMIPRFAGKFTIPPVTFSYFDTQTKQYKTLSSGEFAINVLKGDGEEASDVYVANFSQQDVKFIGSDIRFIKTTGIKLFPRANFLITKWSYHLAFVLAFILFVAIVLWQRKKIRENANLALKRNKKANATARKRLKQAAKFMSEGNKAGFYEEITKAVWGYLADKLSIPLADLSRDSASRILTEKQVNQEMTDRIIGLIDNCEFARYAPPGEVSGMKDVYEESAALIMKIENNLK